MFWRCICFVSLLASSYKMSLMLEKKGMKPSHPAADNELSPTKDKIMLTRKLVYIAACTMNLIKPLILLYRVSVNKYIS